MEMEGKSSYKGSAADLNHPTANRVRFSDVAGAGSDEEREDLIREVLSEMTLDEKIDQMTGSISWLGLGIMLARYNYKPFDSGANRRLGIPPIRFTDGPRGVALDHSTCFPVSMARGATWDPKLEERVGNAIGIEARSQGCNFFGGVCINVPRHPGWGRAQETFGDDPYHLGVMGAAMVRGLQRHVMACAKHYACNSIEEARFFVDVRVDERTLREIYLPHFKVCVDAGVAAVMSAYNKVNGEYCGHNSHLLRDILKRDWGFDGLVMSDFFWGVRDGVEGANGGLDIEMPKAKVYGRKLKRAILRGLVKEEVVDEAAARVIRQKARFAGVGEPGAYDRRRVAGAEHADLALEVARKGIVLLKNESGALPLERESLKRIAVIGELAARPNVGDRGSSQVRPPYVVTALQGIRDRAGSVEIEFEAGRDVARAMRLARECDAAVVVAGLTSRDEGEAMPVVPVGGDRENLDLSGVQEALIKSVAGETDRCIVVLEGGSAITVEGWKGEVEALMMAWYPGMEGGHAIADVLFGDVNPSGKLPITFPKSTDQLPFFDRKARSIEYGYYHGYRLFDKEGLEPAFAYGFGLSYTTFAYGDLRLSADGMGPDGELEVKVDVTNTGGVAGDEVVQLYVGYPGSGADRPVKELKGFARLTLQPGETKTQSFVVRAEDLAYYETGASAWKVEEIEYLAYIGPSSSREDLILSEAFRVSA
jgi:beta-glucosidase